MEEEDAVTEEVDVTCRVNGLWCVFFGVSWKGPAVQRPTHIWPPATKALGRCELLCTLQTPMLGRVK